MVFDSFMVMPFVISLSIGSRQFNYSWNDIATITRAWSGLIRNNGINKYVTCANDFKSQCNLLSY